MGAKGIISSSANIMPAEVVSLYNACINNEKETITKISSHLRFLDKLKNKLDDNVYGIYFLKYILSLRKVCKYHVTMPFNYTIEKSSNVKQFYDYLFESKPKNTIKMHEYDVKKAEKVEVLKYNN
jgi:dihydrodipicolinate synthase/N-acetylneuraminate lyase